MKTGADWRTLIMNTLNRSCMYKVAVIDHMLNPTALAINSSNTEQGDLISIHNRV